MNHVTMDLQKPVTEFLYGEKEIIKLTNLMANLSALQLGKYVFVICVNWPFNIFASSCYDVELKSPRVTLTVWTSV